MCVISQSTNFIYALHAMYCIHRFHSLTTNDMYTSDMITKHLFSDDVSRGREREKIVDQLER